MATRLVSDGLWFLFAPLPPPRPPRPKGGRPSLDDRAALTGIPLLKSGIPWQMLPQEMGCGSGMTCWRRLRDWQEAGLWQAFHHKLLDLLGRAGLIDWSRCALDTASLAAKGGGDQVGPNPTDRGKPGSKRHLVMDRQGIPLAVLLSAANVHDSILLDEVIDRIPPVRQLFGPASCTPTRRLTSPAAGGLCAVVTSRPELPVGVSRTASGWDGIAGLLNGRCPGSLASDGLRSATNGGQTST